MEAETKARFAAGDEVRSIDRGRQMDFFRVTRVIPGGFYRVDELEYVSRFGCHKVAGSNIYHESELEPA